MTDTSCGQKGFVAVEPDHDSAPWWAAVAERRFTLPFCESCARYFFPPLPTCPRCAGDRVVLREATGRGQVYSWVVIHRALDPRFAEDVPYTIVAVDLEEGARMFGRYSAGGRRPAPGERVQTMFYTVNGQNLVGFRPEART